MKASGSQAFHLAHPSPPRDQYFAIERSLLLSATSVLRFASRLGWSASDQEAVAQISLDDGQTWVDVYAQTGDGTSGEAAFTERAVSLGAYAGRVVKVRAFTGEQAGTDHTVVELVEDGSMEPVLYVPQRSALSLPPGARIDVDGPASVEIHVR